MHRIIYMLLINAGAALAPFVQADTIKLALASPLECKVISAYGYFLGYSGAPESGASTILDFKILQNSASKIDFTAVQPLTSDNTGVFAYIPYPVPFKISKKYFYGNGKPRSVQFISKYSKSSSVIIEVSFAAGKRRLANIRVESEVTIGMVFMECNQATGIINEPSGP